MGHRTAYVLVFDGFADWEPASALAELRRTFGFSVVTIGLQSEAILSMGGLRVVPDLTLPQFKPESADLLILPGGGFWMNRELPEVSAVLGTMAFLRRPIAAICAATLAVAHAGLLNDRAHTSNGRGFIDKHVPQYCGHSLYRVERAVRDRQVITANGLAPFAFAAEIFRTVVPERSEEISTYETLYSRGLLDG
jgi:putative intracellular protease/amidase